MSTIQAERRYFRRYGLTLDAYHKRLLAQHNCCAICGRPASRYRLCVDHNHQTGTVRGLLCTGCNTRLSILEDPNKAWRRQAEVYLAAWSTL